MYKEYVISLTSSIVNEELQDEVELFSLLAEDMYDSIQQDEYMIEIENKFGVDSDLVSKVIMSILSFAVFALKKEGIKVTKLLILQWLQDNKQKIQKKLITDKQRKAFDILIQYLKK